MEPLGEKMRKPYNYRNPTAQEIARLDRIDEVKTAVGFLLLLANLVGWCIVLK